MRPQACCSPDTSGVCNHPVVQVEAATQLTVLALARDTFLDVLGPLEAMLTREKSPQVCCCMRRFWPLTPNLVLPAAQACAVAAEGCT